MSRPTLAATLLFGLVACGESPKPAVVTPITPTAGSSPASATAGAPKSASVPTNLFPPQLPRSTDARYREAAAAFERGDFSSARALWLALPDGLDATLLGARIQAALGDEVAAVRAIESARSKFATQGRVYATAAEIHAASGRLSSAEDEIREGLAVAGPTPELSRARGVLALCREGGASKGLEHLLAAVGAEPELEFCARPLSQAHVLLGNAALAAQNALDAAAHAKAALKALPDDTDAKELLGDALAGLGDFAEAISIYEDLLRGGAKVEPALASLCVRGATVALVDKDREVALQRYLRARELGLNDEELGFGTTVLAEEARRKVDAGLDRYDANDFAGARALFEEALHLDPDSLEASNHLGVVLFKAGEYAAAADKWKHVLELAHARNSPLPEPVHLNLARALHQVGRVAEVRAVLQDYLAQSPDGEFAADTRAMLAHLDAEKPPPSPADHEQSR